jgi:hypothetical protein
VVVEEILAVEESAETASADLVYNWPDFAQELHLDLPC